MNALSLEALQQRVVVSDLGRAWGNDPLMDRDVWLVQELGHNEEESLMQGTRNIHFEGFSLPWLKLLAKLTTKAGAREKHSINTLSTRISYLRQLDKFLVLKGYSYPEALTDVLLREFASKRHSQEAIVYAVKLWTEEGWLQLTFTPRKFKKPAPKVETIPEEVLYQIYEKFDLFPPPLERLFRLQLVLGCRIGELQRMPRQCLKQERDQWFLLRWIEKRKHWRFYQIHSLVAELIREQQKFLDTQFSCDSKFDKLFCSLYVRKAYNVCFSRFNAESIIYVANILGSSMICSWLQDFRREANLQDKHGERFKLTSHMFRRTKASIMAYCEADDEYIAAVLGHGSLDMLPHYRNRSLDRLEKEAATKGYVDMYGRVSSFKPRKRRYEQLAELLKVTTPLGECHRPTMLGDCQSRYACLSCNHHRVTLEDKLTLEADVKNLQKDLEQSQSVGQERRVTEINRLLTLLESRLQGLEKLQNPKEDKSDA